MPDIESALSKLKEELPSRVKLVAVSKFHPAEDVRRAYDCGQRLFGESRPQELKAKAETLPDDIQWHFIGHLQTNKLKMVLPYATMVESVDSLRLLEAIDRWGGENAKTTDILLEYHIASEESKQGFDKEEILEILLGDKAYPNVRIRGLMGMATFTDEEDIIRADFSKILNLKEELAAAIGHYPNLTDAFDTMSFGMSGDYGIAVGMGADIVRIGTKIFGERNYR